MVGIHAQGAYAVLVDALEGSEAIVFEGVKFGKRKGWIKDGTQVVCLRTDTNSMEVLVT